MTLAGRSAFGAAILVPLLAACGGGSSASPPSTTPTATATATSTHSPASVAASASPSSDQRYRQLTSNQLVKALLGLEDMPAGYTADKPDLTDSNVTFCHYKQPNRESGYASITFERSTTSVIGNTLRQYGSVADASAQQTALAKAVQSGCSMTDNGTTLKVAEMSAPNLGDCSIGVSMTSDTATFAEVFVQVGPVVLMVGEGNTGSPDVAKVSALAKKSIAKYRSAAANH